MSECTYIVNSSEIAHIRDVLQKLPMWPQNNRDNAKSSTSDPKSGLNSLNILKVQCKG